MNQTEGDDTERLKEAEKKLHEAEQRNKVLFESVNALKEQVEEVTKYKDDFEESLKKKAKEHADLAEMYCNIEKENHILNQKVFQLEEGENDKLRKESNKQGESIQHLQAVVNRREKDIKAKDHGYQRLLKASQADKKEYEARLEKKEEQINALNKRLSEFENTKARYATELKRLKEYETIHQTLLDDIRRQEIQLKNAEMDKLSYKKTMQSVERAKQTLWEENQSLLLRLSKIAGANLTHDNPNIADLSDGKRPTKLAEEFSELYDNEWTEAFEAIEIEDDKEKTTFMLKILQRANNICHELSNAHLQNIKESLCSLTLHIHVPPGNIDKRQTKEMVNGTDNRQTEMNVHQKASLIYLNQQKQNAEWIHAETSTEKNVDDENINKDQSTSEPVSDQQQSQSVDPLREDGNAKHTSHKMHLVEKQEEIDHSNKSSASGKNLVGNAGQINDDVVSDKTQVVPNKSQLLVSDKIQKVHGKKNVAPHQVQAAPNKTEVVPSRKQVDPVLTELDLAETKLVPDKNPVVPVTKQMLKVDYDFEKMPNDQKKVIMELRKFIEISVSDQLETAAAKLVVFEFDLDPEKNELIVEFVRKCMNVCWSMCMQEPPVHIGFPSIQGDQSYDTSIYKPYTKTGKFLDFVVWPAVYLHEGGPLLSKGVAQGRN